MNEKEREGIGWEEKRTRDGQCVTAREKVESRWGRKMAERSDGRGRCTMMM